jgi:hypothetical protein
MKFLRAGSKLWLREISAARLTNANRPTGKTPPTKALVKGLAKELDIDGSYLEKLAEEVRKDLGGSKK